MKVTAYLIVFKRSKLSFSIESNTLKTACGSCSPLTSFFFGNNSSAPNWQFSPNFPRSSSKLEEKRSTFPQVVHIYIIKHGKIIKDTKKTHLGETKTISDAYVNVNVIITTKKRGNGIFDV